MSCSVSALWGNVPDPEVKSPKPGQSLTMIKHDTNGQYIRLVKNNHPTLGYDPLYITDSNNLGTLIVKFIDNDSNKIIGLAPGLEMSFYYYDWIDTLLNQASDSAYWIKMYGSYYHLNFIYNNYNFDTIVYIEPDSITYFTINVNSLKDNISENALKDYFSFSSFPNPFSNETTIQAIIPGKFQSTDPVIKIYNLSGELSSYPPP